jgi:hypothetical protein
MNRFVRLFALTVILLALATPSFALCRECADSGRCMFNPESGTTCMQIAFDACTITGNCAIPGGRATLLDQFTIASVEITTPAGVTKSADAPQALALVDHHNVSRKSR